MPEPSHIEGTPEKQSATAHGDSNNGQVRDQQSASLPANRSPPTNGKLATREYKIIARVIYNEDDPSQALIDETRKVFRMLRVSKLSDLETTEPPESIMKDIQIPSNFELGGSHLRRLHLFLAFASAPDTTLADDLNSRTVRDVVDSRKAPIQSINGAGSTASSQSSSSSEFKITIPEIPPFSGDPAQYWIWIERVHLALAKVSLEEAITDSNFHTDHEKHSKATFAHLSEALFDGTASHVPTKVTATNGRSSAYELKTALDDIFVTEENKAHFLGWCFDKLLALKLDDFTAPDEFINAWWRITNRMQSFKTLGGFDLANPIVLRWFLLKAIESDAYSEVRQYIIDHPAGTIEEFMKVLRARHNILRLLNKETPINEEGQPKIATTRRAASIDEDKNTTHQYDRGSPPATGKGGRYQFKKWHMAPIPQGFEKILKSGLWNRLQRWHSEVNGTTLSPNEIHRRFGIKLGKVLPPSGGKRKARRANVDDDEDGEVLAEPPTKKKKTYQILSSHKRLRRTKDGTIMAFDNISTIDL